MSLIYNDNTINKIFYNGSEVKTVVYNGAIVFQAETIVYNNNVSNFSIITAWTNNTGASVTLNVKITATDGDFNTSSYIQVYANKSSNVYVRAYVPKTVTGTIVIPNGQSAIINGYYCAGSVLLWY